MKLDKFIQGYCCNYSNNGCIGIWKNGRFNNTNECIPLKKEEPKPCNFFRDIVLPYTIKLGEYSILTKQYKEIDCKYKIIKEVIEKEKSKKKRG